MNFDNPAFNDSTGFAKLGGGLKYAFLLDPVSKTAVSDSLALEFPIGNCDVFQGEGKGLANMIVSGLKLQPLRKERLFDFQQMIHCSACVREAGHDFPSSGQ